MLPCHAIYFLAACCQMYCLLLCDGNTGDIDLVIMLGSCSIHVSVSVVVAAKLCFLIISFIFNLIYTFG